MMNTGYALGGLIIEDTEEAHERICESALGCSNVAVAETLYREPHCGHIGRALCLPCVAMVEDRVKTAGRKVRCSECKMPVEYLGTRSLR